MVAELPFVTVLMPIRNEEAFIELSLGSVLKQDYPAERMEVVIADGMSEDNTRAIIQQMTGNGTKIPVVVVDNPGKTNPAARNIGIRHARGEVIVIVDGHCEIEQDYLSQCIRHLQENNVEVVGGPIETIGRGFIGEAIAIAMSTPFGVGGAAFRTNRDKMMLVDTVAFGAYKREVIEAAGPFDEKSVVNEDDKYSYRLRSLGFRILMSPHIRSRYYSRSSLKKLWRQYFRYGFYKVPVFQAYPRQMSSRQFVPPLFVASLVFGGVLSLLNRWILRLWLMMIALYSAVNLAASWQAARKTKMEYLSVLPIVFASLHLSYGAGFLAGLLRFWRGWFQSQDVQA